MHHIQTVLHGSTNCGILPSQMEEHGVSLENMDNMGNIENWKTMPTFLILCFLMYSRNSIFPLFTAFIAKVEKNPNTRRTNLKKIIKYKIYCLINLKNASQCERKLCVSIASNRVRNLINWTNFSRLELPSSLTQWINC